MEPNIFQDTHTRVGTAGGTLFAILLQLHGADILKTAVLAVIGGVVSFAVSLALKSLVRYLKKH